MLSNHNGWLAAVDWMDDRYRTFPSLQKVPLDSDVSRISSKEGPTLPGPSEMQGQLRTYADSSPGTFFDSYL